MSIIAKIEHEAWAIKDRLRTAATRLLLGAVHKLNRCKDDGLADDLYALAYRYDTQGGDVEDFNFGIALLDGQPGSKPKGTYQ